MASKTFSLRFPRFGAIIYVMKKLINSKGFHRAMRAGETWTSLDCQLSELKDGTWYFEIDKHVFYESGPGKKDADWEQLANGHCSLSFEPCERIWNNLIDKYNPDEYFVDQDDWQSKDMTYPRPNSDHLKRQNLA
jgi:hypothetical protein